MVAMVLVVVVVVVAVVLVVVVGRLHTGGGFPEAAVAQHDEHGRTHC